MITMGRDEAREAIKDKLEEYLLGKGIDTRKPFHCLSPGHEDKHPSMSYDRDRKQCHCFSCRATLDTFDVIGIDYGLTEYRDQFNRACEVFGIEIQEGGNAHRSAPSTPQPRPVGQKQAINGQTPTPTGGKASTDAYLAECKRRISQTDYPLRRGLSAHTLEKHGVGFDPAFNTKDADHNFVKWQALIIPTGQGSYTVRNTDPQAAKLERYRNRGTAQIFAYNTLHTATEPIAIVEGEIDAMSIEEAGGSAIGLGSLNNVDKLLSRIRSDSEKPTQPLLICLDNETDQAVRDDVEEATKKLTDGLQELQIPHYRVNLYGEYHDANEALTHDRAALTEAIIKARGIAEEEARKAYLSNSAKAHLQDFYNGIAESANTDAIKTGFETLDKALDGGLYEGLYTIGAISSLGKTSLVLQIADQVAKAGGDVLYISLEMSRSELMAKSISRHTLTLAQERNLSTANAKTARGITAGKRYAKYSSTEIDLINDAVKEYGEYADRLYILEGIGDIGVTQIREQVEKHIRYTGHRPLCVIDYLQILSPNNIRATDKQNIDKAVLELKRLSRDYKLPVICISSFNRENYKEAANFTAFKESGSIEYSSDCILGLQLKGAGAKNFNEIEEKMKNPRQVELVILKSRQSMIGTKITFNYYPMFNYFKPITA